MRVTWSILAIAAAASLSPSGPAFAGGRGSMEDQMACTPDVYRLCSQYVPDEDAIVACLKKNVRALSGGCRQVMTRPDSPASAQGDDD